uniref:FERM and PDZ domain containing 3 n=1 Tax=Callorhinchus milii TaxID=7868 RepID=A0A4W3GS09_CALMI
ESLVGIAEVYDQMYSFIHVMHAVSYNDMECGHHSAFATRQVEIKRDSIYGFGFVAGSEKPVIVRAVTPGGPSEGKLIPGDQILAIDDEVVSTAPRERVIDLVRNDKDSIFLTVLQPHQSSKSAFISAAKKAQLRSNPVKVRFSEEVTDLMKEETLMLIANVLKVYLENGQMKSFTFDSRTTVKDVILSLQDRLSIRCIEHFALVLEVGNEGPGKKLLVLHESETLIQVVQRSHFNTMKCILRITFFPKDPVDLLRRDPVAFEYLYAQSCSDVMRERFTGDLSDDVMLRLTALHIYITVSNARSNQKISLRNVEKDWGLEMFLPGSLLPSMKEKHARKVLSRHLKATQAPGQSGKKVSTVQAKLQYLRILNELPLYPGGLFNSVVLDSKQSEMTLLVGPQHGISHVIDLKTNLTTILAEFGRVNRIQLFREKENIARVELSISEAKPIVLLMESTEAVNFACLIAGYYQLFVDMKKMIFCGANVQSQVNKTNRIKALVDSVIYCFPHSVPRHSDYRNTCNMSPNSPDSNLVRFHFLQMQERRKEFENQIDINENLIFFEETRPRTKSDPTMSSSAAGRCTSDGRIPPARKCSNSCSSRENIVDLTTLPLPGSDEEDEEHERHSLLPTLAAPPPGFRDNSSDEDDSKRRMAQSLESSRQPCEILFNDVPVSLINGIQTRTVRHRAQELDDALVSTLQALEALAAAEDCPHRQPKESSGLIVLAAMTPESSLDSGHETNSSEMTDISEMVSAFKQHHLLAYQGNKAGLIVKKNFPSNAARAQAVFRGPLQRQDEVNSVASTKLSPLSGAIRLKPGQMAGYCKIHMRPLVATHSNEQINVADNIVLRPVLRQHCPSCTKAAEEVVSCGKVEPKEVCTKILKSSGSSRPQVHQDNSIGCGSRGSTSSPASIYKDVCSECVTLKKQYLKVEGGVPGTPRLCECHLLKAETAQRAIDSQGHRTTLLHTCSPLDNEVAYIKVSNNVNQQPMGKQVSMLFDGNHIDLADAPAGQSEYIRVEKTRRAVSPSGEKICFISPCRYPVTILEEVISGHHGNAEKAKCQGHVCPCKTTASSEIPAGSPRCPKPCSGSAGALPPITSSPVSENVFDAKQHTSLISDKAKSQKVSLLNFRNLFSATFPARFRKESDERQEQLQKVKQYELEFLEELLKPKTKVDVFAEEYVYRKTPSHCPCQIKNSSVGNIPGLSREQRRSCDCKRLGMACDSLCFPTTPSPIQTQRAKVPYIHQQPKTSILPSSSDVNSKQKDIRRRTSSLESSDLRAERDPGVFCTMAQGECLKVPHGKKLGWHQSSTNIVSEAETSDVTSQCSESTHLTSSQTDEPRNLEKGREFIRKVLKNQQQEPGLAEDPSYVHVSNKDKLPQSPAIFSIQGEFKQPRTSPLLKGDMASDSRCCSFRYCFYYRNCDVADDGSDKDELSYSIPMQLLPDLRCDSPTTPTEKQAKPLQPPDTTAACISGDAVQQEAAASDSALDSNMSRISALRDRVYVLPDGFAAAQQDTGELLSILRQCVANRSSSDAKLYTSHLEEYKQTLTMKFKELRTACRRVAAVDKSPTHMLTAIMASFQVLCGLIETFVHLVYIMRSERQRKELLAKVEEVVVNYTFLLRAAEESSSKTHPSIEHLKHSTSATTVAGTFTHSFKTLTNK